MSTGMGVDVGGSGIKGAVVDLETGDLAAKRFKLATPQPSTPEAVAAAVARVVRLAGWKGPVGCTVPGVIQGGVVHTAANIDKAWIGADGRAAIEAAVGARTVLINDADAAGLAEMRFGAGRGRDGVVVLLTFGTGIGSALFVDGHLVPNTELGHLVIWDGSAEVRASANAKVVEGLTWKKWAKRVTEYLAYLESLLWPDLIIFGGGISRDHQKFLPLIGARAEIVPAQLRNNAGIVGAALAVSAPDTGF